RSRRRRGDAREQSLGDPAPGLKGSRIPSGGRAGSWRSKRGFPRGRVDYVRQPAAHEKGEPAMIDLYTWPTPNGHKIHIMLEECGLPYNVIPVDIGKGDQFDPEFLKISPNNKMPAMVDPDGPDGEPIS